MEKYKAEKHPKKSRDDDESFGQPFAEPPNQEDDNGTEREAEFGSKEELTVLQKELESCKQKAAENLDGWVRERADFLNYRKRIERDQVLAGQQIKGDIMKNYLEISDDLELALKSKPEFAERNDWIDGIELILRKLQAMLESEGILQIDGKSGMFDPNIHEAISYEPNPNFECGEIIEVVQNGYKIGNRVLRPAKVRVAR